MRIEFLHCAREDFFWGQARMTVGSAADSDLVLDAQHVAARHLLIEQDRRGWVLKVQQGVGRVYVNARPVRERALLRHGDVIGLGEHGMLLHADEDPIRRAPRRVDASTRCPVALRAVAGPLSGRVFPLRERLRLGPQTATPLELPQGESTTIELFWRDGELRLAQTGASSRYPLRLNGTAVDEASLHPDDQLGLAAHRFVLDAPGMTPEPPLPSPAAAPEPLPEDAAGPRGEVWWLIVTAAVLALGIALALLIRF